MGAGGDADLWPWIIAPDTAPPPADDATLNKLAGRLADALSPALAKHVLAGAEARLGRPLIAEREAEQSRLANRFTAARQAGALRILAAAGISCVCLKGYANAHLLYPDPDMRMTGDLDILIRGDDLGATIAAFETEGYGFVDVGARPWGFISDASFLPLVSNDGICNVDLHIHPDCYPAYRSLTTELVFARARTLETDPPIQVPDNTHGFVLCATNAAKNKFGAGTVRRLIDALFFLRQDGGVDWGEVATLARSGHFMRPMQVFCALLNALGVPMNGAPERLTKPPRGLRGVAFRRLLGEVRAAYPGDPGLVGALWRELALCTDTDVGLYNGWLRLRGLVRPRSGYPAPPA